MYYTVLKNVPAKAVPQRGSVLYITVLSDADRNFMAKFSPYAVSAVVTIPEEKESVCLCV